MNYTWFASAYDNDDTAFRILTLVIMGGALTMAAGIKPFFANMEMGMIVIGYVIMRMAQVVFWLRAARHDIAARRAALCFAGGISVVQLYWVSFLLLAPDSQVLFFSCYALGILLELAVPAIAERIHRTPWHRHHIIERYGLLNIIVLGETLLAGSLALGSVSVGDSDLHMARLSIASLVVLFSMWWLYFSREEHLEERGLPLIFAWRYGHFIIFMAGAAAGAGFAVLIDVANGQSQLTYQLAHFTVAIPVAIYWAGLWFVRDRLVLSPFKRRLQLLTAVLIACSPLVASLEGTALLCVLGVFIRNQQALSLGAARQG